jgi:hypothetical protein
LPVPVGFGLLFLEVGDSADGAVCMLHRVLDTTLG